jgi:hypothetical protein
VRTRFHFQCGIIIAPLIVGPLCLRRTDGTLLAQYNSASYQMGLLVRRTLGMCLDC